MSLYTDLNLFLTVNGISQTTAQLLCHKLQKKVQMSSILSTEEVTLAKEFIKRGVKSGAELTQLNNAVNKSSASLPRTNMIGDKISPILSGIQGNNTAARSKPHRPSENISFSYSKIVYSRTEPGLQPSEIRQLTMKILSKT